MQQAQQLGRYHLLDRIAFGGMAEIYRAKTADASGRLHLMAVKRVLAHLVEDDEFIQMLIDEACLTALLNHPNIARVYEFCKTTSEYFISMEYVDGKDLRALLEKARQAQEYIPEEHLAYVCMMTARGLHYAHHMTDRQGNPLNIVHRDVSPSNVLISYAGEVKLCDFGIAKAAGARSQTKTGVIKGKVKYMSPEQAMGKKLDGRSDLFSLGTLLYEMVALAAPFHAQTEIELLFAVRDARKRPIRELRSNISSGLESIIETAMAKQKERRFQDGEEFAESLRAFLLERYPGYGPAQLSRYMQTMFAREREREQKTLNEYVITSGNTEAVGENLLADVLGPDAEYTQFTAAFGEKLQPAEVDTGASLPNPMQQMRVLSSVSMPELIEEVDEVSAIAVDELEPPTFQRPRMSAAEIGLMDPPGGMSSPSAATMPRGHVPQSAATSPPQHGGRMALPTGNETAILSRDTPGLPNFHNESTHIVGDSGLDLPGDDEIHAQQTHILSRDQVEAMIAKRLGRTPGAQLPPTQPLAPPQIAQSLYQPPPPRVATPSQAMPQIAPPSVLAPDSLADDSDLHAASTQILSVDSLPASIREVLQRRSGAAPSTPAAPPVVSPPPVPPPSPAKPALNLQPLDGDLHEVATAYLDWSPIDQAPRGELPAPPDPSMVQPARPLGTPRSATGGMAPIQVSPPRSQTGAQAPISPNAPPRSATGAQVPIATGPARAPIAPVSPPTVPATPSPVAVSPAASSAPPMTPAASSAPPARAVPEPPAARTMIDPPTVRGSLDPPTVRGSLDPPTVRGGIDGPAARTTLDPPPRTSAAASAPADVPHRGPTAGHARVASPVAPEPVVPRRSASASAPGSTPAVMPASVPAPAAPSRSVGAPAEPVRTPTAAPVVAQAPISSPVVMAQEDSGEDEWESLPHLDSTMMARGSELAIPPRPTPGPVAPVRPRLQPQPIAGRPVGSARPAEPVARAPVVEDFPTIPPSGLAEVPDELFEDDGATTSERTPEPVTDAALAAPVLPAAAPAPAAAAQAVAPEPVTQPKAPPVWDDLGINAHSDFAEDTDKGGGPRGFGGGARNVDPAPYLSGSGKGVGLPAIGKTPGKLGGLASSPRVPTSGQKPGSWGNDPKKK